MILLRRLHRGMITPKTTARIAGLLYLFAIVTGIFSMRYVPSQLIVWNNAVQTMANITAHETLFRLGIVAAVFGYTAFFLLPLVLYRLLSSVSKPVAVAMVALAVVSVPFSLFNLLYKVNVLSLLHEAPGVVSLPDQVVLNLHYYNNGLVMASVFWGLWLLPFGYLVLTSGFFPRILGILLMIGCFGYVFNFTGLLLSPGYGNLGISRYVTLPASLGELGVCLWMLTVGIRQNERSET
jgi:hypothetical protein